MSKNNLVVLDLSQELTLELAAARDEWTGIDLLASIAFLHGRRGSHGGTEYFEAKATDAKHLKAKIFEERTSRQALARLLRGPQPLSRIVRHMLANLIDFESQNPRELCFRRRRKTRLPASIRDHDIAYFVAWQRETGKLLKNAKNDAMVHFGKGEAKLSKSTVNRAWRKHGAVMTDRARGILATLKEPYTPR